MKVAHFKHEAAFLIDVLFISIHCRLSVTIIGGVVFSHFLCFPFFCVNVSAFIETHSVFVCALSLPSFPLLRPLSPTHGRAASQSEAQKKLQPVTQVPVLQEQGEYCAGVGGV